MSARSLPALGLEREYGEKIDRCITDTLLKAGAGLIVGGVFSFALFKRRAWPVTLGTGIGLGIAYRNCEDNIRGHYIKEKEIRPISMVDQPPKVEKVDTSSNFEHCNECEQDEKPVDINLEEVKNMAETLISHESDTEKSSDAESSS